MLLPADLIASLKEFKRTKNFYIAFSGGLDSHVLLHALHKLPEALPQKKSKNDPFLLEKHAISGGTDPLRSILAQERVEYVRKIYA